MIVWRNCTILSLFIIDQNWCIPTNSAKDQLNSVRSYESYDGISTCTMIVQNQILCCTIITADKRGNIFQLKVLIELIKRCTVKDTLVNFKFAEFLILRHMNKN